MTLPLWSSLATIIGVWAITVLSPGPNLFTTVHIATTQSRQIGLILSLGITVGTAIWATASLIGLGVLFETVGWLYQIVKLAGGGFLVYLGVRMVLSARRSPAVPEMAARTLSARAAFWRGVVVDLSNPKAAIFFTSLFAFAVPADAPMWYKGMVVGVVALIAGGWYALVACAVNFRPVGRALERVQRPLSYAVGGGVFIAFGARIASDTEPFSR
jgi:threonine/homoserine/homoserine lactone efflux protein